MNDLVSVIMPVYNMEKYVAASIQSVLNQTHQNWELLVVDDGSIDDSGKIVCSFKDKRIFYIKQNNQGVSGARNLGLSMMKGAYFCFLDADDWLTTNSLESRLSVFNRNPELNFVDGKVSNRVEDMSREVSMWSPNFNGMPLEDLISLTGKSFFGITWMIKKDSDVNYEFDQQLTHAEDLWFYIGLSKGKIYGFTDQIIYLRRLTNNSAMSDLDGLANGYRALRNRIEELGLTRTLIKRFTKKTRSILFKSYLVNGQFFKALSFVWKL